MDWPWLALKLLLIGTAVWASSVVSKRWGHATGGLLAGMPLVVGPIMGLLLIDLPAQQVRAAALATLVCQPALIVFMLVFAHTARWQRWWLSLGGALGVYVLTALGLSLVPRSDWLSIALALLSPLVGLWCMPKESSQSDPPITLPRSELVWRVIVAMGIAALILGGAARLSPLWAGVLLAAPIAGAVLPSFTLPRHGPHATVRLLRGFILGQRGFVAFFIVLLVSLPILHPAVAWVSALLTTALVAHWAQRKQQ